MWVWVFKYLRVRVQMTRETCKCQKNKKLIANIPFFLKYKIQASSINGFNVLWHK